jgi:Fic family protein
MKFTELLEYLDQNKDLIDSFGKLDDKILKKISYKFRLDWNYYSNRIEGGTLTREETKSVMANLLKIDNKSKKDFMEMDGHDKQVLDILKITKGLQTISPKRIKEMHKSIMYEEVAKEKKQIGQWKTENNFIYNYKGERYDFVPFSDVPDAIQELCNWINAELEKYHNGKSKLHAVEIAAKFHYDYVNIHPFYDGNGRTARLLTNLIFISCGYQPIIIKDQHKDAYGQTLADAQAYGADESLFYQFIGDRLMDSQKLMISVLAGEDIDEEDDLDKRLKLLEQQFEAIPEENEIKKTFNFSVFDEIAYTWFSQLIKLTVPKVRKFDKFFIDYDHTLYAGSLPSIKLKDKSVQNLLDEFRENYAKHGKNKSPDDLGLRLQTFYGTFKKGGFESFGCSYGLEVKFDHIYYTILISEFNPDVHGQNRIEVFKKLYSETPNANEINYVSEKFMKNIADHIEYYIKPENRKKTSN